MVALMQAGDNRFEAWGKWVIAAIASLWVSADLSLKILSLLAIADVAVNLFNPAVSLLGICRRLAITFILVLTVHVVYSLAKTQTGLNVGFDVSGMVTGFYCIGESIAILKGCAGAGIGLPPALIDLIAKAEGLTGSDKAWVEALRVKQAEKQSLDLDQEAQRDKK